MADKKLDSLATSVFCDNLAMMFSAGIAPEEACGLLAEDAQEGRFHDCAADVGQRLSEGATFTEAMRACACFPDYVSNSIEAGEASGRTEETLRSLASFYADRNQLEGRIRSAVIYPTILLLLMSAILLVMLFAVLPTFRGVYESLTGSVAASSYSYINIAYAICWIALAITAVLAAVLIIASTALLSNKGAGFSSPAVKLLPGAHAAGHEIAAAQFASTLETYIASGLNPDDAFARASKAIEDPEFAAQAQECGKRMEGGEGLAQAVYATHLLDPLYARMLISGSRSGRTDEVLSRLSRLMYADAQESMAKVINTLEPALAGFLTIAVGLALVAVMLPLIGIMGGIG